MSFAQELTGKDRSRSEAISLETSTLCFHCTTVLVLFNPLAHIVSMSRGGGFGMRYGNMVNILTLPAVVPFAWLTS